MKTRLDKLLNQDSNKLSINKDVHKSFLDNGLKFPLLITSAHQNISLKKWISANKDRFESDLLEYGAVLFRGFKIFSVEKFHDLMDIFPKKPLEYKFRSSPRFEVKDNIYISTIYPQNLKINMHSENSYSPSHPDRIVFCCAIPAEEGGETPIADNRMVLRYLSEKLKMKFLKEGIKYNRNLNGVLGLQWQEVFQSSDKAFVEQECASNGIKVRWNGSDGLVLTWNKKAIWEHPVTGEQIWFNHGLFFNKYMLHEDLLKSITSDDDLPNNTSFGNGSAITEREIEEIKEAYNKSTTSFKWEKGDILFLDNMLFSHGRNPYKGDREILVSIS